MITDAMVITRGSGVHEEQFDFSASTPTLDITADDKWMCQIQENQVTRIIKLNSNAGGDDDQILLDAGSDGVKVTLTEKERNEIPDSGYSYKLYKFNETDQLWEVQAYAAVTSSGSAPAEYTPEAVPWVNGHAQRVVTGDGSVKAEDDFVYGSPAGVVDYELTLPDADTMVGKIFHFKNSGAGTVTVITPNSTQVVQLNDTTRYAMIIALGTDANSWLLLFKA